MQTEKERKLEMERRLAGLKKLDPIRLFIKKQDVFVKNGDYDIRVRVFFPSEQELKAGLERYRGGVLFFLHGGGWVKESVDTYERICSLMARATGSLVLAAEYRRAPEFRFPMPLLDSYAAARALYAGELLQNVRSEEITLIGDSAGGNLTAAVALLARERGDFRPARQILIYPALWNDYTESSPFPSVRENGRSLSLTSADLERYQELYARSGADRQEPLFAPLLEEDLSGMPDTLILTAGKDPLRDEGEEYARRLKEAGNYAELHRIEGAPHGFFALGIRHIFVEESLRSMDEFLRKR